MEYARRRTDRLTERELLVAHTVEIETLCDIVKDMRGDLNKHYEMFDKKVDWRNFKWIVGLLIAGILCLTGYTNMICHATAENKTSIEVLKK